MTKLALLLLISLPLYNCDNAHGNVEAADAKRSSQRSSHKNITSFDSTYKTIHVFVALCDNKYQGIVPVPAKIGNGQDPDNNLYWGCGGGIRTYFKNSKEWTFIKKYKLDKTRLERAIFKHKTAKYYLIADAYDGQFIKQCTIDFLKSCAGQTKDTIQVSNTSIGINGNAKLVSYIGHDGLMDFSLDKEYENADNLKRDAIILACISKRYFAPLLKQTKANPLVWTTGLMAPEAYTLHDALRSYINKEPAENIRSSAAKAYSRYQKCSEKAARNLLVSGW
jgi:hypothetical protein